MNPPTDVRRRPNRHERRALKSQIRAAIRRAKRTARIKAARAQWKMPESAPLF